MAGLGDDLCVRRDPPRFAPPRCGGDLPGGSQCLFHCETRVKLEPATCSDASGHWTTPSSISNSAGIYGSGRLTARSMRYFYQDQNHEWIGPYTMEELRQLHLNGIAKPDTPTMVEGGGTSVLFKDLSSKSRTGEPAGSTPHSLISVAVLSLVCQIPPLSHRSVWITAPYFLSRFSGFLLGVSLPEETCKVLILYYLWRRLEVVPPQTILFYGLISGLGFGIYEGVDYQTRFNWFFSGFNAAEYYLLNLIRLTTLPFLHAIWTGIAGY